MFNFITMFCLFVPVQMLLAIKHTLGQQSMYCPLTQQHIPKLN